MPALPLALAAFAIGTVLLQWQPMLPPALAWLGAAATFGLAAILVRMRAKSAYAKGIICGTLAIAAAPTTGSADLCLIVAENAAAIVAHLAACGIPVEVGPVVRTGALGPIESVYVRDPDGNLIELARYVDETAP